MNHGMAAISPSSPVNSTAKFSNPIGPFLKWAGGKSRLLAQFQKFLPDNLVGRGYVEPFLGSGAMFFHIVQTRRPERVTLLDANPELVNLFTQIRDHLPKLIPLLIKHRDHHNAPGISVEERKAYYYNVRDVDLPASGTPEAAARFLYLNKTCFNGLYRLNSKGKFNVPIGSYRSPSIFNAAHLATVARLLEGVRLLTADFRKLDEFIQEGDFVYLDPPYEPLSATSSFTAYAKERFTAENQRTLRDLLIQVSSRCQWLLSNSTAPLIEELYEQPGMYKHYIHAGRAINSKAEGRGHIPELVVTNYQVQ
ncbi:Site-specific DNA-methyltransferase (adenine-specific) [Gammaproteobacteria bacterium]